MALGSLKFGSVFPVLSTTSFTLKLMLLQQQAQCGDPGGALQYANMLTHAQGIRQHDLAHIGLALKTLSTLAQQGHNQARYKLFKLVAYIPCTTNTEQHVETKVE